MKNLLEKRMLFCLFIFFLGTCSILRAQQNQQTVKYQQIKVMSFNIWSGFYDPEEELESGRLDRFVTWIKQEAPDVLAMQELCHYDEAKLKELAARYGHQYVAILVGDSHPIAFTSKYPIREVFKKIEGFGHGLLHCKILGMDFLVTHLNPKGGIEGNKNRKLEADNIVNYIQDNKLEKCLLMGDFNAHSPFDAPIGVRDLGRYTAISTFMGAGLHDICYIFNSDKDRYTFPTQIKKFTQDSEVLCYTNERLDYIFVTDALFPNCVDGTIYRGADVECISDHTPISITMFLPLP